MFQFESFNTLLNGSNIPARTLRYPPARKISLVTKRWYVDCWGMSDIFTQTFLLSFLIKSFQAPSCLFWNPIPHQSGPLPSERERERVVFPNSSMALAHFSLAVPVETSNPHNTSLITYSSCSLLPIAFPSSTFSPLKATTPTLSVVPKTRRISHKGTHLKLPPYVFYLFGLQWVCLYFGEQFFLL